MLLVLFLVTPAFTVSADQSSAAYGIDVNDDGVITGLF